ncbi:hypothetical protein H2203_009285 [Taxawa tesnikishii (nom. ined.)]|nr:hypothetical protein H2203_009285 [Dothideales sp. JES 119]
MSDSFILHGYHRSSCSARLRIVLDLKQIPYTPRYINIKDGQHLTASHASLNPSLTVPVLEVHTGPSPLLITQSIAALEYLEEAYPSTPPLLPARADAARRALWRAR